MGERGIILKRSILTIGTVAVVTLTSTMFTNTSVFAEKSLKDINSERQEIKSQLSKAEQEIADVLYEMKDINEEIAKLDKELQDNRKQVEEIEGVIDEYEQEITIINKRIEERNEILKQRISSYQDNGGNLGFLEVFMGANDFMELISRVSAVTTMTNADIELIEEQEKDKEAVEIKLAEQEDLYVDLKETEQAIEEKQNEQKKAKKTMEQKEAQLTSKKAELETEDSDLAALESEIRAEMATFTPSTPAVAAATTSNADTTAVANATTNTATANGGTKAAAPKVSAPSANGGSAISAGMSMLGTPYVPAGKGPGGFDCSGFVAWAYGQTGKSIPSYTGALINVGTKVSTSEMQPGDLVFFDTVGSNTHVGIYVGGGNFIASNTTNGVEVKSLSGPYWKDTFNGHVRRVN